MMKQTSFEPSLLLGLITGLAAGVLIGVPLQLVLSSWHYQERPARFGGFPSVRTEQGLITLVPSHPVLPQETTPRPAENVSSQAVPTPVG